MYFTLKPISLFQNFTEADTNRYEELLKQHKEEIAKSESEKNRILNAADVTLHDVNNDQLKVIADANKKMILDELNRCRRVSKFIV